MVSSDLDVIVREVLVWWRCQKRWKGTSLLLRVSRELWMLQTVVFDRACMSNTPTQASCRHSDDSNKKFNFRGRSQRRGTKSQQETNRMQTYDIVQYAACPCCYGQHTDKSTGGATRDTRFSIQSILLLGLVTLVCLLDLASSGYVAQCSCT